MSSQRIDKLISYTLRLLNDVAEKWEAILPHDNLPPSFGNTRKWVSLVQEILGGIEDQRKANSLDPDEPTLLDALESAKGAAKNLSAIFRALLQGPYELVNDCIIEATVDQDHKLAEAIGELSSLQPSMPMNQAAAVAHYGKGDLFSNLANGHQNINKGTGAQYISERMNWAAQSSP
ncbi:hypothetical protein CEP52_007666 [Fusarium oligoseptatum]|uniref:NACHT-NTPase and P-loop NTPases N-terminal domain-containing protein n=1 Tax=Fusarium oligoseptatum TaxID=2604345 RepID=A0A428TLT5_9HYPO|nr:hypothetical protein CEP52_007666 [Fusarium oligoseptatum]